MCSQSKIYKIFLTLIIFFAFVCANLAPAIADRAYLPVHQTGIRKVVIAVPWFTNPTAPQTLNTEGKAMAQLLSKALEFHGFIDILDPNRYGGRSDVDWKALGADYVVLAKYESDSSGMLIEGRVLNVGEDKMLTGRRYRGSLKQRDDMVLRLCDALIEEFSGTPGISRSKIAFVSDLTGRKELYISDVMELHTRQVTSHKTLVVSPRFSPDGNFLAYSSYHSGNQNLYVTDLRQSANTTAISRRRGSNLAPAWSPDGKTMVVMLSKDGNPDLYLMDLQGKILRRLTARAGINVSPSWSPDGKTLAFVSDRSGAPHVYLMDMKTYRVKRLTFEGRENTEPVWSPDGNMIAYTGLRDGNYQVFTIDPSDSSSSKQITSGWGEFETPAWSPDGRQIAFSRRRNNRQQICVAMNDGRNVRVLLDHKGNQTYPQWTAGSK